MANNRSGPTTIFIMKGGDFYENTAGYSIAYIGLVNIPMTTGYVNTIGPVNSTLDGAAQ